MSIAYADNGLPYGFGWMSTKEMKKAIAKYLKHFAICESYTELQAANVEPFRILFLRKHFICLIRCLNGIYYFDSLGPVHLQSFLGFSPPNHNEIPYQQRDTATCGAFVCLMAAIYSTFAPGECTISNLQKKINHFMSHDVVVNEFNILVFTATQGIGEEFDQDDRYEKTKHIVTLCENLSGIVKY
jgi:hypothetical protein